MQMQKRDVWAEVLKRIPAKDLGECLCVCKTWYSLIVSPSFITSQALSSQSQSQSQHQFLLRVAAKDPGPNGRHEDVYRLCSYGESKTGKKTSQLKTLRTFRCPFKTQGSFCLRVLGSVHGVLCISDDYAGYDDFLVLWNPLVRKFVKLPGPPTAVFGPYTSALGFGYDSQTGDYKVVRLAYPQTMDGLDERFARVDVYSLRVGIWRRIPDRVSYFIPYMSWSQCFLRGSAHWVAYDMKREGAHFVPKSNCLLLFDFEQEKFKRMTLPACLSETCPRDMVVSDFQGLLSVIYYEFSVRKRAPEYFDLWIKKDYQRRSSWTKVLTVDCATTSIKTLVHWRPKGEALVWRNGMLVPYNPDTKKVVTCGGAKGNYHAYSFSESLVFLEKGSPAVSYQEESHTHKSKKLVPSSAGAEKEESDSEDKDRSYEDCFELD